MEWWHYVLIGLVVLAGAVYFGLPALLHALGIHPSYNADRDTLERPKCPMT